MRGDGVRNRAATLLIVVCLGATPTRASAQDSQLPVDQQAPATTIIEPPSDLTPPAAAAPPPAPPPPPPAPLPPPASAPADEPLPGFMTLDRMDASSRIGVQIGFDKLDGVDVSDLFLMRYEPYAQFVFPDRTTGVYGQVPFAHLFDSTGGDGTAVGNLELGGFYMPTLSSALVLRGGFVLDTASSDPIQRRANLGVAFERLTDVLQTPSNYSTLRVSASTVQTSGRAFFRGDVGFDVVVDKPSGPSTSLFFRANAAAGVRVPGVDLAAELVNIGAVNGDIPGGVSSRFIHTLAITGRTKGVNQVHLGLVVPLDEGARGELWCFSTGYQRVLN